MQIAAYQQRRGLGIIGMSLIVAAIIVLVTASFHVRGLPSTPFACDEFECADPIYDLRTPYALIAGGAVLSVIVGFILVVPGRPIRWGKYSAPPRRWSRVLSNLILWLGLLTGVLLPWWILMMDLIAWNVPTVSLIATLGAAFVHVILWWWLRRQSGQDRRAWNAALAIQIPATILTAAVSLPLIVFAALTAPAAQLILLFIGAKMASNALTDEEEAPSDERCKPASPVQIIVTGATVTAIAAVTVWASWARPIPEDLQPRIAAGDWPIRKKPDQSTSNSQHPTETTSTPSETPPGDPTQTAPPCDASALEVSIDSWDASTGSRSAALVATNAQNPDACQLQGLPGFRIIQADEDLEVIPNERDSSYSDEELYSTITLQPGRSAEAILYWRGERGAYHDDSAQQVEVKINNTWVEANFEFEQLKYTQDSPFDLIQHSEIEIGQWSPIE